MAEAEQALLTVRGLRVEFDTERGPQSPVRSVDLELGPGETVALVGESGCGKSVTALSILGLGNGRIAAGEIQFKGRNLAALREPELRQVRGKQIGMVFQEPMTSLNPVLSIAEQLEEALLQHLKLTPQAGRARALELLQRVGIASPEARLRQYPHELSGGMRQRVMIAMAIACGPELLIADEPTTALDVSIQAQIMALLRSLQQELKMATLLITHDLGLVAHFAQRVEVMYAGKIVERGSTRDIFKSPAHPYTRALLGALPDPRAPRRRLEAIPGRVPTPQQLPAGCAFCTRCPESFEPCAAEDPPSFEVEPAHRAACWLHDPKRQPTRRYRREIR